MSPRGSKWLIAATTLLSGSTLYTVTEGACARFGGDYALTAFDACWLLDCTNGIGGGAIPLCDPNNPANNLLIDCSPAHSGSGGGSGGTSGSNPGGPGGSGGSGGNTSNGGGGPSGNSSASDSSSPPLVGGTRSAARAARTKH